MAEARTQEFVLAEYSAIRSELEEAVRETRSLERFALIALGTIWSWVLASAKPGRELVLWLPALLIAFLGFRASELIKHIEFIGSYLAKVEATFSLPHGLGFEQNFLPRVHDKRRTTYLFWSVLMFVAIVLPAVWK